MSDESYECDVVVAETVSKGILGMNILERYGVTLNMHAETMQFPGRTVVCLNRDRGGRSFSLYNVARVTVSPKSECVVPVRSRYHGLWYTAVVEARTKSCETYGLVPGRAVVDTTRDSVPMLVTNTNSVSVEISLGQLAARCSFVRGFILPT
jgi:hypothetical protein